MGLVVKQTNAQTPDGKYFAKLIGVYDIGTQPSDRYDPNHQVILQWELHNKKGVIKSSDGKPLNHSQFFTLAFGINRQNKQKAKLRELVENMLGRAFTDDEAKQGYDLFELVGMSSVIKILEGKITAISETDEDDPELETEQNEVCYQLDPEEEIPSEVPDWIAKRIRKSHEWVAVHGEEDEESTPRQKKAAVLKGSGKSSDKSAKKAAKSRDADEEDDDEIAF
jgi:hypothetical protein